MMTELQNMPKDQAPLVEGTGKKPRRFRRWLLASVLALSALVAVTEYYDDGKGIWLLSFLLDRRAVIEVKFHLRYNNEPMVVTKRVRCDGYWAPDEAIGTALLIPFVIFDQKRRYRMSRAYLTHQLDNGGLVIPLLGSNCFLTPSHYITGFFWTFPVAKEVRKGFRPPILWIDNLDDPNVVEIHYELEELPDESRSIVLEKVEAYEVKAQEDYGRQLGTEQNRKELISPANRFIGVAGVKIRKEIWDRFQTKLHHESTNIIVACQEKDNSHKCPLQIEHNFPPWYRHISIENFHNNTSVKYPHEIFIKGSSFSEIDQVQVFLRKDRGMRLSVSIPVYYKSINGYVKFIENVCSYERVATDNDNKSHRIGPVNICENPDGSRILYSGSALKISDITNLQ
ncbi:MAG: hypothetical protein HQL44_12685 [Alphaproteobacteria bacterium]|nr:hypothetical protein [Alphaproteobacteria bacterium]